MDRLDVMTGEEPLFGYARSNWQTVILVCRKCERRLGDRGFGLNGKDRLTKSLRKTIKATAKARNRKLKGRGAPVGIVNISCQRLCPRAGVTVVLANQPDRWLVAPAGVSPERVLALALVNLAGTP